MKQIRHNTLMSYLFTAVMSLPLLSIAVRCAYTIVNKNAYQSYSGNETIETIPINTNSFEVGQIYYFSSSNYERANITNVNFGGSGQRISFQLKEIIGNSTNVNLSTMTQIAFYKVTSDNFYYFFAYDNNGNALIDAYSSNNNNISFSFYYVSNNLNDNVLANTDLFYQVSNFNGNYLDNVFDYSVNKFIEDNNFGQLNLTQWFTDLFLDSSNAVNNQYVNFINWYLNYALMVSCMYLLFILLGWFINFSRKMLERGMNYYDW